MILYLLSNDIANFLDEFLCQTLSRLFTLLCLCRVPSSMAQGDMRLFRDKQKMRGKYSFKIAVTLFLLLNSSYYICALESTQRDAKPS